MKEPVFFANGRRGASFVTNAFAHGKDLDAYW